MEQEWYCIITVGSGVQFKGTSAAATDHLNAYMAHVEKIFRDNGLMFLRKQHMIVPKPTKGGIDINAEIEAAEAREESAN